MDLLSLGCITTELTMGGSRRQMSANSLMVQGGRATGLRTTESPVSSTWKTRTAQRWETQVQKAVSAAPERTDSVQPSGRGYRRSQ